MTDDTSPQGSPWTDLGRPPLRVDGLRRALLDGRGGPWTSLDIVTSTGSTNADLTAAYGAGTVGAGAVLAAEHQVAGRGRRDRDWTAPPRSSLTVSVLLVPDRVPQARWQWLPLVVGVGVASALAQVAQVETGLKWPNDVLAREPGGHWHKVCGILAEVVAAPGREQRPGAPRRGVVIGFGLNVGQRADELPPSTPGAFAAGSLAMLGAGTTDRDTVLRAVLRAVGERYERFEQQEQRVAEGDAGASHVPGPVEPLSQEYRSICLTIGHDVVVHLPGGRSLSGRAVEVDEDGRLVVLPHGGGPVEALAAGDVVHVRSA